MAAKKQELVILSMTEAEYIAATHAAKEAIWLRRLIDELIHPLIAPTTLFCDNKSTIALMQDGHHETYQHTIPLLWKTGLGSKQRAGISFG